jgi:hypothetical protein
LSPARRRIAAEAALGAAAILLLVTVLGDLVRPGYDAATQYISELGELGAPNGALVSLGGFLPIGFLVLAFLALALPELFPAPLGKLAALLLATVPLAYVVAAFARCDPGCPMEGTARQTLHNTFGFLEYIGGTLGLFAAAASFRSRPAWRAFALPTLLAGAIVLVAVFGVGATSALGRGTIQRIGDATFFLWFAAAGWRLRASA